MKRVIIVFVILVVGLSVGLWLKVRQNSAALTAPSGGSGVIEGVEVQISARIPSRITKILVQEGDAVTKGQLLVELDCRENRALLSAARARLLAVESSAGAAQSRVLAALGNAQAASAGIKASGAQSKAMMANREAISRQEHRIKRLQGEGGATASDLDRVSTQVQQLGEQLLALQEKTRAARGQAKAARANAKATEKQAEAAMAAVTGAQAQVERASALTEECQLKAPIAAVVLTRANEPGEVVLPGSQIMTLVQLGEVETTFFLPNRELAAAAPGKAVTLTADPYPGEAFKGKIHSVAAKAEFSSRTIQTREDRDRLVYAVQVRLPNPSGKLRPGMPVEVRIDGTGAAQR